MTPLAPALHLGVGVLEVRRADNHDETRVHALGLKARNTSLVNLASGVVHLEYILRRRGRSGPQQHTGMSRMITESSPGRAHRRRRRSDGTAAYTKPDKTEVDVIPGRGHVVLL